MEKISSKEMALLLFALGLVAGILAIIFAFQGVSRFNASINYGYGAIAMSLISASCFRGSSTLWASIK